MELWVRTQGKDKLVKIEYVQYVEGYDPIDEYDGFTTNEIWSNEEEVELGQYKTKERCLEVIDEIQKLLLSTNGDYLIKLQDIDVNAEIKTVYGENFIQKLQSPIMPIANEPSVQFVQPSVLVYEMPKE